MSQKSRSYDPKEYWERRLSGSFSARSVGHIGFCESYNVWLYRRKNLSITWCLRDMDLHGKAVLDIGSGTGFFVNWYLQRGAKVCGIDITHVSIERLKAKYPCELYVQDVTDKEYSLADRQFDLVNMWDVSYHIVDQSRLNQAFENISKSLRSGGLLLFTDWFGATADVRVADHVQARCLESYQRLLPKMGFSLSRVYPLYRFLNKEHFGVLDNYLGWAYFLLDGVGTTIPDDNLSLSVWRYTPNGAQVS